MKMFTSLPFYIFTALFTNGYVSGIARAHAFPAMLTTGIETAFTTILLVWKNASQNKRLDMPPKAAISE